MRVHALRLFLPMLAISLLGTDSKMCISFVIAVHSTETTSYSQEQSMQTRK